MIIEKKRVHGIARHLEGVPPGGRIRPVARIDELLAARLPSIGFGEPIKDGDTVLPRAEGPVRRLNADGGWRVHRDRPKEDRYVRTVSWSWRTWDGAEHEDFRDIHRACFPRTRIEAPAVELTIVKQGKDTYLAAPAYSNDVDRHDDIRHAVNLLLEIAGVCELRAADLGPLANLPRVKRVAWAMLPPGRHPYATITRHLDQVLKQTGENARKVIQDRQKTILAHGPDEFHVGLGGFENYIAYVFGNRGLVVLECIRHGNAVYVFGRDWQELAKLSKAEVIDGRLHVARIVHSDGWKDRLSVILARKKTA